MKAGEGRDVSLAGAITPASEAHSSGGGGKAQCREQGSCEPCKSHPETSAVKSDALRRVRELVHGASPLPCGAEWGT